MPGFTTAARVRDVAFLGEVKVCSILQSRRNAAPIGLHLAVGSSAGGFRSMSELQFEGLRAPHK